MKKEYIAESFSDLVDSSRIILEEEMILPETNGMEVLDSRGMFTFLNPPNKEWGLEKCGKPTQEACVGIYSSVCDIRFRFHQPASMPTLTQGQVVVFCRTNYGRFGNDYTMSFPMDHRKKKFIVYIKIYPFKRYTLEWHAVCVSDDNPVWEVRERDKLVIPLVD